MSEKPEPKANFLPAPAATEVPASEKFKSAMKQILSVPKAEIDRREAEYQKQRKDRRPSERPQ